MKSQVQAVIFDKHIWTTAKARQWLKTHGYKPIKHVDTTLNLHRYRIRQPSPREHYRLQALGESGVKLVLGWPNA